MPRYYFHVHNRERLEDDDGTVLADKKSAVIHALGVARELMFKRSGMLGQPWSAWTMRVKDKNGKTIHTLPSTRFLWPRFRTATPNTDGSGWGQGAYRSDAEH